MATNERNVDRMVEVIDSASQHARRIYYLYLGFIVYCAVTVWATTDTQLALKSERVQLPILDITEPLDGFFLLAPIIVMLLYIYFIMYLNRLNVLIDNLESYCKENRLIFNKKDLYPWMINIVREPDKDILGFIQKWFVRLTLWFSPPIILFIFAFKLIKKHDSWIVIIITLVFASSIFIIAYWFDKNKSIKWSITKSYLLLLILAVTVLFDFYIVWIIFPQISEGKYNWANLDLRNELLVNVPDKYRDFEGVYWADLEGVNWNGADLTSAVLKRANLRKAKLNNARLYNANLQKADLIEANLQKADLRYANLQEAVLLNAKLQEADLEGANLWQAELKGVKRAEANLQEANLEGANLQEAYLAGANLQGAIDLTKKQLCNAKILINTRIDEDLLIEINADKECAYKLTKESYDKWLKKQE